MPSTLDLGLIAVVLISAFLAMVRGFSREILAILSWGAAAAAAVYFYPLVVPFLSDPASPVFIAKETIRPYAAGAAVFFVTLILVSIVTIKLSDAILDSRIGALDRSLGFLFGAFRGLLLCAIGFIFFNWLAPDAVNPEPNSPQASRYAMIANSRTLPLLRATADRLLALLPDDPDGLLAKLKKPKGEAVDAAPPPETDAPARPAAAPPSPPPRPTKPAPAQDDKQKLEKLLNPAR